MRPGLAKIIVKVRISRSFESPETDLQIAANACCIDYADTPSAKWVHWLLNSEDMNHSTTNHGCGDGGIEHWSCLSEPTDHKYSPTSASSIENTVITTDCSQPRMKGPSSSTSWKLGGHSGTGTSCCRKGIQLHCIPLSLCAMTCSIIWMVLCELYLWRRLNGRMTYTSP